jgi:hypothetical protein
MSKYQFCTGCEFRVENPQEGEYPCPARFDPYDKACPKNEKFMTIQKRKRTGMAKPRKQKPGW